MRVRSLSIVACSLALLAPAPTLADCAGGGPKPGWVDRLESIGDEYYYAAGVSDDLKLPLAERLAAAKQSALKSLSEIVEVSVKNSLTQEQTSRRIGGKELTEATFQSITQTSTSASLRNVETVDTWEDPKTCAVWLRVRVAKRHVEHGKQEALAKNLFALLGEQIALAQNEATPLEARQIAAEAAQDVLPRIALDLVPEASSKAYYLQLLKRLQGDLQQRRDEIELARKALREADASLDSAVQQNDNTAKAKLFNAATGSYRSLLAKHANGLAPLFGSGDLLFKLGEAEEMRGSQCAAKSYYQQAADAKHIGNRQAVAKTRAEAIACSAEDMEKALWRQRFEGRTLTVVCYYRVGDEQVVWHKACDTLSSVLKPLGADLTLRTKKLTPVQLKEIEEGNTTGPLSKEAGSYVGIYALGKIAKRVDPESPNRGNEYQFDGGLATVLVEDGKVAFSDRFQGKTGWNPVSSEMVMDVLAINVVKRWRDKFSQFLRGDAK